MQLAQEPMVPPESSGQDALPYLQPKGELDDLETRKHELEAGERRYEFCGDDNIPEVQGSDARRETCTPSTGTVKHELAGEELAKEIGVPRNALVENPP